jgi:hypothetical protein
VIAPEPLPPEEDVVNLRKEEERRIELLLKNTRQPRSSSSVRKSLEDKNEILITNTDSEENSIEDSLEKILEREEKKIDELHKFTTNITTENKSESGRLSGANSDDEIHFSEIGSSTDMNYHSVNQTPKTFLDNTDNKENKLPNDINKEYTALKLLKGKEPTPFMSPKKVLDKFKKVASPRGEKKQLSHSRDGSITSNQKKSPRLRHQRISRKEKTKSILVVPETKKVTFNDHNNEEHTYQPLSRPISSRSPSPPKVSSRKSSEEDIGIFT